MKLDYSDDKIKLEKELNALDKFTIDFVNVLDKIKVNYVLVSGYVSILFGRSRSSEDIDIILGKISHEQFQKLWNALKIDFECITTRDSKEAYHDYLITGHAIRFSKKGEFIPNMEIKFPKVELDAWTLKERKEVVLNEQALFISPLELQISFKLFLGSEKDIEDAKYLYELFKEKLNSNVLRQFNQKLKIEEVFDKYLR